jgi:DNA-binding CsgD family transcriptional regulator
LNNVSEQRSAAATPIATASGMRDAVEAFLNGDNAEALNILTHSRIPAGQRVDAALLSARTLLRMRQYEDVLSVLSEIGGTRLPIDQQAARIMLVSTARYRLGKHRESLQEFWAAHETASASKDIHPTVRAETAYFYALALWSERSVSFAEAVAKESLNDASDIVEVRILELLGWIQITNENLAAAAPYFAAGIEKFAACVHQDVTVIAGLVHGAANIAVETLNREMIAVIRETYPLIKWADADRWRHGQVAICLGRLAELDGDTLAAWEYFEAAKRLNEENFYSTFALIAEANLLARLDEQFGSNRLLDEVARRFEPIQWSETNAEERIALLTYAFAAASYNTAAASKALMRARSIWEKDDPLIAVSRDDRLGAYFLQASGAVRLAHGDRENGLIELRAAFDIWVRFKYSVRAASVAFILWDATREDVYRSYIERVAEDVPKSWIARRIGFSAQALLSKIHPAERRVLDGLIAGMTTAAIAEQLGKSHNTIKTQKSRLFQLFGVRNRTSLLAKCLEAGLKPTIAPTALRPVEEGAAQSGISKAKRAARVVAK